MFASFAEDAHGFGDGVDVCDVEGGEFAEADAAGVEEFEDGLVACGGPGGGLFFFWGVVGEFEHGEDLGFGEGDGEFFFCFGELDFEEGVLGPALALAEVVVEGAEGGEVETDGGAGEAGFHLLEEVVAVVVWCEGVPGGEFGVFGLEGVEGVAVVVDGALGGVFFALEEGEELFWEGWGHGFGGCVGDMGNRWNRFKCLQSLGIGGKGVGVFCFFCYVDEAYYSMS